MRGEEYGRRDGVAESEITRCVSPGTPSTRYRRARFALSNPVGQVNTVCAYRRRHTRICNLSINSPTNPTTRLVPAVSTNCRSSKRHQERCCFRIRIFDWRAHRNSAIRQVGTVEVKERTLGDLEEHIPFNVYNSPKHLVQKQDVRFEFDKRSPR